MILNRKGKQYSDELRVINLAINRFGQSNDERFLKAKSDPKNRDYLEQIESAMGLNSRVKNNEGWYIFDTNYIIPWIERREKVLKLIEKERNS